jgi:hypothetical protein
MKREFQGMIVAPAGEVHRFTVTQKRGAIRQLRRALRYNGAGSRGEVRMVLSEGTLRHQSNLIYQCRNEGGQLVVEEL